MIPVVKAIVTLATAALCIVPLIFTGSDEPSIQEIVVENKVNPDVETYEDTIALDQSELCLDHEVIQYNIVFHVNATVKVDGCIGYIIRDLQPVAYLFYLTDGEQLLVNYSYCAHVPSGTILDITTRRNHFKIGGRIFYRMLNIGRKDTFDKTFSVHAGDTWYLTIGVYCSIGEEEVFVNLKSTSPCMELIPLERHDNIGLFSSWDNGFSGAYFGVRMMPFLPFGFSFADNVKKEITTTRGTVVSFLSVAHRKGETVVRAPDGTLYVNNDRGAAGFIYYGNLTGVWIFKASGIGFPWKHIITLFYTDVDPHIRSGQMVVGL